MQLCMLVCNDVGVKNNLQVTMRTNKYDHAF